MRAPDERKREQRPSAARFRFEGGGHPRPNESSRLELYWLSPAFPGEPPRWRQGSGPVRHPNYISDRLGHANATFKANTYVHTTADAESMAAEAIAAAMRSIEQGG